MTPNGEPLTPERLEDENAEHAGTCGVSLHARQLDLVPAFRDDRTGRIEIARFEGGCPAPVHVIDGLPSEWALQIDASGKVVALRAGIVSGFVRNGVFYTREEAARLG